MGSDRVRPRSTHLETAETHFFMKAGKISSTFSSAKQNLRLVKQVKCYHEGQKISKTYAPPVNASPSPWKAIYIGNLKLL